MGNINKQITLKVSAESLKKALADIRKALKDQAALIADLEKKQKESNSNIEKDNKKSLERKKKDQQASSAAIVAAEKKKEAEILAEQKKAQKAASDELKKHTAVFKRQLSEQIKDKKSQSKEIVAVEKSIASAKDKELKQATTKFKQQLTAQINERKNQTAIETSEFKSATSKFKKQLEYQVQEKKAQSKAMENISKQFAASEEAQYKAATSKFKRQLAYQVEEKKAQAKELAAAEKAQASANVSRVISGGLSSVSSLAPDAAILKYKSSLTKTEAAQLSFKKSVDALNNDFKRGKVSTADYGRALSMLQSQYRQTATAASEVSKKTSQIKGPNIGTVASGLAAGIGLREIVGLVDGYTELNNRLRIVTNSESELVDIRTKLTDIALATRTNLEENSLLYLRLSMATESAGESQERLLKITETVNKAVQLGGSSAQEAQGAIRQFTQIISAGFKTGFSQELNSLSEQTPGLFKLITDGLAETSIEYQKLASSGRDGIDIMKEFSEEGIGDLEMLLNALDSQFEKTSESFENNVNVTISKSLENLRTSFQIYIGSADEVGSVSSKIASAIDFVAKNLDKLAAVATFVAGVITAKLVYSLSLTIKSFYLAATASKAFMRSLGPLSISLGVITAISGAVQILRRRIDEATSSTDDYSVSLDKAIDKLEKLTVSQIELELNKLIAKQKEYKETLEGLTKNPLQDTLNDDNEAIAAQAALVDKLTKQVELYDNGLDIGNKKILIDLPDGKEMVIFRSEYEDALNDLVKAQEKLDKLESQAARTAETMGEMSKPTYTDEQQAVIDGIDLEIQAYQEVIDAYYKRQEALANGNTAAQLLAEERIKEAQIAAFEELRIREEFGKKIDAVQANINKLDEKRSADSIKAGYETIEELKRQMEEALADLKKGSDKEAKERQARIDKLRDALRTELETIRNNYAELEKINENDISSRGERIANLARLRELESTELANYFASLKGDYEESEQSINEYYDGVEQQARNYVSTLDLTKDQIKAILDEISKARQEALDDLDDSKLKDLKKEFESILGSFITDDAENVLAEKERALKVINEYQEERLRSEAQSVEDVYQIDKEAADARIALEEYTQEQLDKIQQDAKQKRIDGYMEMADAFAAYVGAVYDYQIALNEIEIDSIERQLKDDENLTDEQKVQLEERAKAAFESNKKSAKAQVAVSTAVGIANALAGTVGEPMPLKLLNAATVAFAGAAQYAKISASQYESPSSPSKGFSAPALGGTGGGQNLNITITGNTFGNDTNAPTNVVAAIKDAINNGEIIFDTSSEQWAALQA